MKSLMEINGNLVYGIMQDVSVGFGGFSVSGYKNRSSDCCETWIATYKDAKGFPQLKQLSVFLPESFENLATSRLFGFVKEAF